MHAVLLAAGVGRRLAAVAGGVPKCLLSFDGASLLERQLALLAEAGIERLTLITGYEAAQTERTLCLTAPRVAPGLTVTTLFNPDYREGSAVSCLTAAPALESGDDVLLMDADVLCDGRMLERLLARDDDRRSYFLLDRDMEPGEEPVKLCVRDGRLVAFDKRPPDGLICDTVGESVGFFRLTAATAARLAQRCRQYRDAGDVEAPYEAPLRDLLLDEPAVFGYVDITGLPWIEIDFPEDVINARDRVLPRLRNTRVAS